MNSTPRQKARNLLRDILNAQPNLLQGAIHANTGGVELANFVEGFVSTCAKHFAGEAD